MYLEKIEKPNDIKKIPPSEYYNLAAEIRELLIEKVSKTGGHLASNLGVVELTMALHLSFNLPKDKIIWDVGHQSYTHKLLTGRKEGFDNLRKYGGMSGFPKRSESEYDSFDTGHSSTSVSAGVGIAAARDILGQRYHVVSVIGDGALTGGMAFEAVNNASSIKKNFIIVLNDNEMSIAPNVGGISEMLTQIRMSDKYSELKDKVMRHLSQIPSGHDIAKKLKKTKDGLKRSIMPGQITESLGINYYGPIDGHDIGGMLHAFNAAKKVKGPVIVHVLTKKGKGYHPAERFPDSFHGISPFDINTGKVVSSGGGRSYAGVFSDKICELAAKREDIIGITAAMPDGTGLKRFSTEFPGRYFDVGIAEAHAVTFSAGLAAGGVLPVFAVYSSFLQRGYDQMLHDVCIQGFKVIFALDHAGLVGSDGETHQGIFDLSYLATIPGMTVFAPKNARELEAGLEYAVNEHEGPIALRYPSGKASDFMAKRCPAIKPGKAEVLFREKDIVLFAVGRMVEAAAGARDILKNKGYSVTLVNARFVQPFDTALIKRLSKDHSLLVTVEENVLSGGFGEHVCRFVQESRLDINVKVCALPDEYIEQGSVPVLLKNAGLDAESIAKTVEKEYGKA